MIIYALLIVLAIVLDQITKYLAVTNLRPILTFPIIEDVFHLTYVENTGAAMGLFSDSRWVFMLITPIALIGMLVFLVYSQCISKEKPSKLLNIALSLMIGGGIGNMIDRLALGYVIDFIDVRLINFYVFNVADTFVCIGAALFVLYIILDAVNEAKAKKQNTLNELNLGTTDSDSDTAEDTEISENAHLSSDGEITVEEDNNVYDGNDNA